LGHEQWRHRQPLPICGPAWLLLRPRDRHALRPGSHRRSDHWPRLSQDPLGLPNLLALASDPSADVNLYRCVGNNPIGFVDPSGEEIFRYMVGTPLATQTPAPGFAYKVQWDFASSIQAGLDGIACPP